MTEQIVRPATAGPRMVGAGGAEFAVVHMAGPGRRGAPQLVWGHGWGHSHQALLPLAEAMQGIAESVLIDFPGFGISPLPPAAWSTAEYADAVAAWLARLPRQRRIWVGHSFGCRVGLRLAAAHPELVDGLFLIAAAGLRPRLPLSAWLKRLPRRAAFRIARALTPEGPARDRLRERFGSRDYREAGAMRPTFNRVVNEDQTDSARAIGCPVLLVHGDRDSESRPEIAERLHRLIRGSRLHVLRGFDHWNILTDGRHQVLNLLDAFIQAPT